MTEVKETDHSTEDNNDQDFFSPPFEYDCFGIFDYDDTDLSKYESFFNLRSVDDLNEDLNSGFDPPEKQETNSGFDPPEKQKANSGFDPPEKQETNSGFDPPEKQETNSGFDPAEVVMLFKERRQIPRNPLNDIDQYQKNLINFLNIHRSIVLKFGEIYAKIGCCNTPERFNGYLNTRISGCRNKRVTIDKLIKLYGIFQDVFKLNHLRKADKRKKIYVQHKLFELRKLIITYIEWDPETFLLPVITGS